MLPSSLLTVVALAIATVQAHSPKIDVNQPLPQTLVANQYGYNNCGTFDSPTSRCQTLWINNAEDFCLFAPPTRMTVGHAEPDVVSYCTKPGHGSRLIPKGTIQGLHWIETSKYIQITGVGDLTSLMIPAGDDGGELDPHGPDDKGNPRGGIVIADINGKKTQILEWNSFISDREFCLRACKPGKDDKKWCQHIYDIMGCWWNHPGSYERNVYESCDADLVSMPPGLYLNKDGSTSTWHQSIKPTPTRHAPAKSSNCKKIQSPPGYKYSASGSASFVTQPTTRSTTTNKLTTTKTTTTTKQATTAKTTTAKKTTTSKKPIKPTTYPVCSKTGAWLHKNSTYNRTHPECRAVLAAYRAKLVSSCPEGKTGPWLAKRPEYIKKHPACQKVLDAWKKSGSPKKRHFVANSDGKIYYGYH